MKNTTNTPPRTIARMTSKQLFFCIAGWCVLALLVSCASSGKPRHVSARSGGRYVMAKSAYPSPPPPRTSSRVSSDDSGGTVAMAPASKPSPAMESSRTAPSADIAPPAVERAPIAPVVVEQRQQPPAGILTAASVGDVDRYDNYVSYLRRHHSERLQLGLAMDRRVRVRVVDQRGRPVNDAALDLRLGNARVNGRTHSDGWWDFFPGVGHQQQAGTATVTATAGQQRVRTQLTVPSQGSRQYIIRLPFELAQNRPALDLAFLIDVTGSMGDELRYVNREVVNIVQRIRNSVPNTSVRVGGVFYRDRNDQLPLQKLSFTNVNAFSGAMTRIQAGGGGDYPEDMNAGLMQAMRGLSWRSGNVVRVLVVIADAPPKAYGDAQYRYQHAMAEASARGIRLLPVAASGSNRVVEFLFRAMGAMTSTPYVYLTDDSGVGNPHMEADTDRVAVEKFSHLLTRMVVADLRGKGMHEPGAFGPQ